MESMVWRVMFSIKTYSPTSRRFRSSSNVSSEGKSLKSNPTRINTEAATRSSLPFTTFQTTSDDQSRELSEVWYLAMSSRMKLIDRMIVVLLRKVDYIPNTPLWLSIALLYRDALVPENRRSEYRLMIHWHLNLQTKAKSKSFKVILTMKSARFPSLQTSRKTLIGMTGLMLG